MKIELNYDRKVATFIGDDISLVEAEAYLKKFLGEKRKNWQVAFMQPGIDAEETLRGTWELKDTKHTLEITNAAGTIQVKRAKQKDQD